MGYFDNQFTFRVNHKWAIDQEYYNEHKHECEKQMVKLFIEDCMRIGLTKDNIVSVEYKPRFEDDGEFVLEAQAKIKEL